MTVSVLWPQTRLPTRNELPQRIPHSLGVSVLPTEVPGTIPKVLSPWETWGMSKCHCIPGFAASNCQPCENQQRPTPEISCSPWTCPPHPRKETKGTFFNQIAAFVMLSGLRGSCPKDRSRMYSRSPTRLHSTHSCVTALIKSTWKNNPRARADK